MNLYNVMVSLPACATPLGSGLEENIVPIALIQTATQVCQAHTQGWGTYRVR